ncbi:MAG: hypothetical protein A3H96_20585 [Acidobacteria bacterium RIFCSPLOWO2_02_FULL_67_36]|nr:MAG: hypothetical protein A3H96_20585 [Acidobacteria bacterium RIFCSPLOWO2_02_FULL_67_36]OFW24592.1 MAG: hypothetical protein A3G21_18755 [Acidobacteria bacterium RIFCSPLOWO2_12_FULL_66_21]
MKETRKSRWYGTWTALDDFNTFYYRIRDGRLNQVGTIYRLTIPGGGAGHIGMILPPRYLRTDERADELRKYYPPQRRFTLTQSVTEVDALLQQQGTLLHKQFILELLEKGGKVIFGGSRRGGVLMVPPGVSITLLRSQNDINDPKDPKVRDVLEIAGGKLRVRRYLSAVEHE